MQVELISTSDKLCQICQSVSLLQRTPSCAWAAQLDIYEPQGRALAAHSAAHSAGEYHATTSRKEPEGTEAKKHTNMSESFEPYASLLLGTRRRRK